MSRENVEKLKRGFEALYRGDDARLLADWDEDVEIHDPPEMPEAAVRHGHQGYWEGRARVEEVMSEVSYEAKEFIEPGDDLVLVPVQMTGEARHTGMAIDVLVYWLYHFRDGKVTRVDIFFNRDQALEAVELQE